MNLVIFGPPGAGKGTQSNFIVAKFNLYQLSTGELLRNEIQNKTKFNKNHLYGGDAYLFAMLASGNIDIIIESELKKYDIMALVPIIEGSGGKIINWDHNEINLLSQGDIIAFGDQNLTKLID